jgi:hypothetical protein
MDDTNLADILRRLAQNAESVCRHYLDNGCREGTTWRAGDANNAPGRSLVVRLSGPDTGKGAAGRWTDFASGEHGDLLDLIARNRRLDRFPDVLEEARRFLSLPQPEWCTPVPPVRSQSPQAARRLFASASPIYGTIAETYLRSRGITHLRNLTALRFHANCYYRAHNKAPRESWPALIAAVTDLDGSLTGVLRTWLSRDGSAKAQLPTPRRSLGYMLGHGVRFGKVADVMAAGEGIETVLSLHVVLPRMPLVAAMSVTNLAALILPRGLRRIYVVRDNDRPGERAVELLRRRAHAAGIQALVLVPHADDFNTDLYTFGREALAASLRCQLAPEDATRFLSLDQRDCS